MPGMSTTAHLLSASISS